jgi:hypothetical protein
MEENIAEFYYNELTKVNSKSAGKILLGMYCSIFDIEKPGRSIIIMINKLVKIYNRYIVFFAITSVALNPDFNPNVANYALFTHICNKRFEKRTDIANVESMKYTDSYIKRVEKKKKKLEGEDLVIPESIDE